jgi:hypothetical protein
MKNALYAIKINELHFPVDGYTHDVQVWTSIDNGSTYYHCGVGRYCKSRDEAIKARDDLRAKYDAQ